MIRGVSQQGRGFFMNKLASLILLATVMLSGCGRNPVQPTTESSINCAVEIQIAVVSGLNEGDSMDDGEWHVATSCVLPVRSTGGPGHVVCKTDGTVIELQWDDVQMTDAGNRIRLEGGQWQIRNRIVRRDGVSQTIGGGVSHPPPSFGPDFEWLAACEIDTMLAEPTGRKLVVRGRLLPDAPTIEPLNLSNSEPAAGHQTVAHRAAGRAGSEINVVRISLDPSMPLWSSG
jgi:hypothetical protein